MNCVQEQRAIAISADGDEIELAQEHNGKHHAIYIRPENVIRLVDAIFRAAGMGDLHLYRREGLLCFDVDWPSDPAEPSDLAKAEEQPQQPELRLVEAVNA